MEEACNKQGIVINDRVIEPEPEPEAGRPFPVEKEGKQKLAFVMPENYEPPAGASKEEKDKFWMETASKVKAMSLAMGTDEIFFTTLGSSEKELGGTLLRATRTSGESSSNSNTIGMTSDKLQEASDIGEWAEVGTIRPSISGSDV